MIIRLIERNPRSSRFKGKRINFNNYIDSLETFRIIGNAISSDRVQFASISDSD